MFERFTDRARQVMLFAQEETRVHGADRIDTVAILLGLLREEEGVAARVLERHLTLNGVRNAWPVNHEEVSPGAKPGESETGQIPFTVATKTALELALREALSLGHNYIGTEHILLGLVRLEECPGARMLNRAGADGETIRNEVVRMLTGPGPRRRPDPEPPSDLKFSSQAHAWATGIIGAALMGSEAFTAEIRSDSPEIVVRFGPRRFRLIIEELQ